MRTQSTWNVDDVPLFTLNTGNRIMAVLSKASFCGRSNPGFAGLNSAGGRSGRGLCFGLITRPEEFYRGRSVH
jgi:hypothetical protein